MSEIDHCNDGGFDGIYRRWRQKHGRTDFELNMFVVKGIALDILDKYDVDLLSTE